MHTQSYLYIPLSPFPPFPASFSPTQVEEEHTHFTFFVKVLISLVGLLLCNTLAASLVPFTRLANQVVTGGMLLILLVPLWVPLRLYGGGGRRGWLKLKRKDSGGDRGGRVEGGEWKGGGGEDERLERSRAPFRVRQAGDVALERRCPVGGSSRQFPDQGPR